MRTLLLLLTSVSIATPLAAQEASTGNATRGAAIFTSKGGCQSCHRVAGAGSRLAPDLSEIGSIRTPDELRASLLTPDAEVLPEGRSYRVVTRDGTTITGRLLNLDTYHVYLMDPKEQLRTFERATLREHGFIKGSTMPSFRDKLSGQELADLIAYLSTLKGVSTQ